MLRINGKDVALGMTTCPRSESYIQESLNSLIDNGWGTPLIYSDDDMRGDFWGFLQVARLLLTAYPLADGYIILQDDVVACMSPEEASEHMTDFPLVSLFTMHPNIEKGTLGIWHGLHPREFREMKVSTPKERANNCNGGIAYYVYKETARRLLCEPFSKFTPTPSILGEFCHNHTDALAYLVSPVNIFEHIGEKSSLHPNKPGYKWDVSKADAYRN